MKLIEKIKTLSLPPGVITHQYLTNRNDPFVRQHWQALLFKQKERSTIKHCSIFILKLLLWYVYNGRKNLQWVKRKRIDWPAFQEAGNCSKQNADLFYLAFICTIPPAYYYIYKLYQTPRREWFQFIFDHEVPNWQYSLSPSISETSKTFISSKMEFARICKQNGIPSIATIRSFSKNARLTDADLFQEQSFFWKPDSRSQSKGCFRLIYKVNDREYQLVSEANGGIITVEKEKIKDIIQKEINTHPYIKQPILNNHPEIIKHCGSEKLVTIRIVTYSKPEGIVPVSAILEVADEEATGFYKLLTIDIRSGKVKHMIGEHILSFSPQREAWKKTMELLQIPHWAELIGISKKAHQLCNDIYAVGWDIAITDDGARLIEGNIGWSVKYHQTPIVLSDGI